MKRKIYKIKLIWFISYFWEIFENENEKLLLL
jgi:hypothetical protein